MVTKAYSAPELVRMAKKNGWKKRNVTGSHVNFKHDLMEEILTIPVRPTRTKRSIVNRVVELIDKSIKKQEEKESSMWKDQ